MNKISIKFTVVSLFLFLSFLIVSSMLYIQYSYSKELVQNAIDDHLELLSSKVEDNIQYMSNTNSNTINSVIGFLKNKDMAHFENNKEHYIEIFTNILKNNKELYAVYVGFEDDSFFEVINLNISKQLKTRYNAKKTDNWLLVEINNTTKKLTLLNKNLQTTHSRITQNDYFATSRPWYKNALEMDVLIKTRPYSFSNIDSKGVTFAQKIPQTNNVFALDILIDNLNNILQEYTGDTLQNSYIVNHTGNIIAQSSHKTEADILKKIISIVKTKAPKERLLQEINLGEKQYIYSILPLKGEFLCSYSEIEIIEAPYKERINLMLFLILLSLLVILPLIFYFSSIIVKPILLLVNESKKVKNRKFDKVQIIKSNVLEIHTLSNSLAKMSESIYDYQTKLEHKVKERTIELQEKNKELERLSVTDKLTGLYNRIKLDRSIDTEIERAKRYNDIFGIIIIDIDFFKSVNDTYGHQTGDTILIEFASILRESIRTTDIVGRWGGEEFIIICPESSLVNIMILAEKLKDRIARYNFSTVDHKTASFGVASYIQGEKPEEMIDRADKALYLAKENGRNRVETLEDINT